MADPCRHLSAVILQPPPTIWKSKKKKKKKRRPHNLSTYSYTPPSSPKIYALRPPYHTAHSPVTPAITWLKPPALHLFQLLNSFQFILTQWREPGGSKSLPQYFLFNIYTPYILYTPSQRFRNPVVCFCTNKKSIFFSVAAEFQSVAAFLKRSGKFLKRSGPATL